VACLWYNEHQVCLHVPYSLPVGEKSDLIGRHGKRLLSKLPEVSRLVPPPVGVGEGEACPFARII